MKKTILLSVSLIYLSWCGHQQDFVNIQTEPIIEPPEVIEIIYTWKNYTHTYQDLWIKIITSPLSTTWDVLMRNNNIIYNGQSSTTWNDYMEVFFKNPKTSFEDEIRQKHLSLWCDIVTGIVNETHWLFSSMIWFHIIYIT